MANLKDKLIEILIKSKAISKEKLDSLIKKQVARKVSLRKLLIQEKIISEEELLSILSQQLFLPYLRLTKYTFDAKLIKLVPEQFCRRYSIMPLARMGDILTIAMSDPLNIFVLDDLKTLTGCKIDVVLSSEEEIKKALDAHYRQNGGNLQEFLGDLKDGALKGEGVQEVRISDGLDLSSSANESATPPVVKLVDLMLIQALKRRASDIHIEPEESCVRVRYRIDGSLYDVIRLPKKNQNSVLARLKIISNMNITESRLPQDGRFKVSLEDKEVDFRVSALPTTFGQKFVLRVLDKANLSIGLDKLGFSKEPMRLFKQAIASPFGMILVTGPTGSGKSTSLYSVLNQLNTPERNIITIEDPVEYEVDGITQVQAQHEVGLNFATGLRSILRQSPDIIMVGEIRDSETADIAIKAALTGQLVLSTLHTNDAPSSITRLIDMGVEPFLIASSLVMACAQRLCRKLCTKCRKPYNPPDTLLKEMGIKEKFDFYQNKGCSYCNDTGFFGRVAILEALMIDDRIRQLIAKNASLEEIRKYAITEKGMKTLRDDALIKVKNGVTTLDEAIRVTTEE